MMIRTKRAVVLLSLLLLPLVCLAQSDSPLDELRVSYIYSAVMGSGSYRIEDRQIAMLRIPFAYTQNELTEEQNGLKWHAPVTIGYDSLNYPDWLSRLIDDELTTLTVLPGVELMYRVSDHWVLKPFTNLGAAYDFSREETILMGVLGVRGLGTWIYADNSEFRVGTSARYAAEYQVQSSSQDSFAMLEAGVDYRRDIHLNLVSRDTNAGLYYRIQLFMPEWELGEIEKNLETRLGLIHEIGVSIGLQKPFKILGIPISRVRTGFKFGDNVRGWTIGTDFPF